MSLQLEGYIYHRGLRGYESMLPNSLDAVIKNSGKAVEVDSVLLSDGQVAMLHPADFGKTIFEVELMKSSELKVPFLEEFIGLASDVGTVVAIDLKASSYRRTRQLARVVFDRILRMIEIGGFHGNENFPENSICFQSFSAGALADLRKYSLERGLAFTTWLYWPTNLGYANQTLNFDWVALEKLGNWQEKNWHQLGIQVAEIQGIAGIKFQAREITPNLIEFAKAKGIRLGSSLTDNLEEAECLLNMGISYVMI